MRVTRAWLRRGECIDPSPFALLRVRMTSRRDVSVMGETRRSLELRVAPDGRGIGVVHLYGTPEGVS